MCMLVLIVVAHEWPACSRLNLKELQFQCLCGGEFPCRPNEVCAAWFASWHWFFNSEFKNTNYMWCFQLQPQLLQLISQFCAMCARTGPLGIICKITTTGFCHKIYFRICNIANLEWTSCECFWLDHLLIESCTYNFSPLVIPRWSV